MSWRGNDKLTHSFKQHLKMIRKKRKVKAFQATKFRQGSSMAKVSHPNLWAYHLWRFANKEPQYGEHDFDYATVFYKRKVT